MFVNLWESFSFIQKYCASRVLQVIVCEKISWGFKRGRCEKTLVQNMIYFHWQPGPDLRCFYDTHLPSPDLTGKLELSRHELTWGFPHHTTSHNIGGRGRWWRCFVCRNTEREVRVTRRQLRQWQSCHGRKVRSEVSKYFRIYINILNTTLHSSRDILYAERKPT